MNVVFLVLALLSSASASAGDHERDRPLRVDQLAVAKPTPDEYARKAAELRLEAIRRLEALLAVTP